MRSASTPTAGASRDVAKTTASALVGWVVAKFGLDLDPADQMTLILGVTVAFSGALTAWGKSLRSRGNVLGQFFALAMMLLWLSGCAHYNRDLYLSNAGVEQAAIAEGAWNAARCDGHSVAVAALKDGDDKSARLPLFTGSKIGPVRARHQRAQLLCLRLMDLGQAVTPAQRGRNLKAWERDYRAGTLLLEGGE